VDVSVAVPNRDLLEQAVRFSKAMARWVDADSDSTLSYARMRVLELLHCRGPSRMRDLADQAGLVPRNLTTVADALEAEGLVRRVPHPVDRRVTMLELTSQGDGVIQLALAPRLVCMSQLFDVLGETEKARLTAMLAKLSSAIEAEQLSS
jgi:DNA-binding MarR family transcriptional regulator